MQKNENPANVATATEERTYKARPNEVISTKIGLGVALSYENPAIAEARKVRRGCTVRREDEAPDAARYYESVRKAFDGEGINLNGHIPFRGSLRKEPKGTLPYIVRHGDGSTTRYIFTDTERVTAAKATEAPKSEQVAEHPAEAPTEAPTEAPKGRRAKK
jgi:hypothetical protein